ncbi:DUF2218 domain-containing protein [Actinomadura sp. HBU206391]|uniref:DUF2218 domain-containing protein n=1 Tax=Actinomadura sp. HBU206391 TaxID=2731692 RepID=UPI00164FC66F|nr:DUF2218 domain-containing protein [Actinomadura sp. HBU206391]MBC6459666.1 DUF2218 domain-containing protein [Actinomadura sp. HBU206391]
MDSEHAVIAFGFEAAADQGRALTHADQSVTPAGPRRAIGGHGVGVLTLRAEAADEESLRQLEQRVADRLEQVGRRDRLTVTWTPPQDAGEQLQA